jgi:hypothetical protein
MPVRYVFKYDRQVGILYVTSEGVHVISGNELFRFLEWLGGIGQNDFIVHPEDEEGDRFIELAHPYPTQREAESELEREMEDHGYELSPRRF